MGVCGEDGGGGILAGFDGRLTGFPGSVPWGLPVDSQTCTTTAKQHMVLLSQLEGI